MNTTTPNSLRNFAVPLDLLMVLLRLLFLWFCLKSTGKSYIWIFNLNLSSSSGFVDESDNNLKEIWIGLLPIRMEFPTSRRVVFECSKWELTVIINKIIFLVFLYSRYHDVSVRFREVPQIMFPLFWGFQNFWWGCRRM